MLPPTHRDVDLMPCFRAMILIPLWTSLTVGEVAAAEPLDFVRDIRPIFENHCYACHSGDERASGLRLDVKSAALKGGDHHGPDIVPGKPGESPLVEFITSNDPQHRMPPDEPMPEDEIAMLVRWVAEGAVWPDGVDLVTLKDTRDHWSFKPLRIAGGPATIDAFVTEKQHELNLEMSPPAERSQWLRRVTMDLTGLPPTPQQVTAFNADTRVDAYDRVVDQLLSSPRYGERWAQHWLDVVRYADTHGFEVNTERPNAWPYRDYVIRSFNNDTPYDQFIQEQLLGDRLGADPATGFLVTASVLLPGQIGKDEPSLRLARQDALDEVVNNISLSFLGLSVGCARCHDHKFDPILAKDYYAMQAIVAGVQYAERELRTPEAMAAKQRLERQRKRIAEIDDELSRYAPLAFSGAERPMVNARQNVDRWNPVTTQRIRFSILQTNNLEPCVDELEVFSVAGANVALAGHGAVVTTSGDRTVADRHERRFINDGQYGNTRSWMSSEVGRGWVTIEFAQPETIDRVVWGRDRNGQYTDRLATDYRIEVANDSGDWSVVADSTDRQTYDSAAVEPAEFTTQGLDATAAEAANQLVQEKRGLLASNQQLGQPQQVFAGTFRSPDSIHLLLRGDPEQPLEAVAPAIPIAFGDASVSVDAPEWERRKLLADWLVRPDHPLTARVMVNRIWQGHFGAGLVASPSDFGNNGLPPSHPELLDWLAHEFIRSGWSIKQMHRKIVLSKTYRQSAAVRPEFAAIDADVRYLWRYPSRRLEAESIRDSILAVSGNLNLQMEGRGFDLFNLRGGLSGFQPVETFQAAGSRRMIYAHKVRREPESVFGAFDCPDAGQSTAVRLESTTPIQALNLFNSRFVIDQSSALARRIGRELGDDHVGQIMQAFQYALQRTPSAAELAEMFPLVRKHGLEPLCRALFNSNEFLFLP